MKVRILLAATALCLSLGLTASPAAAQATRTWVSGVGDDANPCSRTAPCKTFAGAISKTAAGGEINCLDPGGFGGVTITKALSLVCQYTEGGVLVSGAGVNGIVVNAGVNDNVYLGGLDIFGAGTAQNGVRFIAGKSLTIENSAIRAFNASAGQGVFFAPAATSSLVIRNTTISNNGGAATGGGVLIQPSGAGIATASLDHVTLSNNVGGGIIVNGASTVLIDNSLVASNPNFGIRTGTGAPTVRVGNTGIIGNGTGVSDGAGTIESYCNNRLNGNGGDGAFFGPCVAQR
jgi:hypothetical protein